MINSNTLFRNVIFLLLLNCAIFFPQNNLHAQACGCTNCPIFMPDNFVGDFLINVMGATSPTLGQNGQGVCGVKIHFDHEYLGDLKIVLTSPGGQSVTLIGPTGLFGSTDGTMWDVSFVPCGNSAAPDPGFASTWSNNQFWAFFGNYLGSYYPNFGCLEDFNSGPVNGTWTLTVTDAQSVDVGSFYSYEIIFCDPSGINCFSCAADAGALNQNDLSACVGSSTLNLNLPPTYVFPAVAPPAADYIYTYVISGAGGVILAYDPGADLSGFGPGSYTVCGMSYLTSQENLIPPPNGSLTTTQLNTQLASTVPPFCGDISSNCVNVTIKPIPVIEVNSPTTCSGQAVTLTATGATSYTWSSGGMGASETVNPAVTNTYTVTGTTNGCSGTAVATVTVAPSLTINVNSPTICNGQSATLNASGATSYTWSSGGTGASETVNPIITTIYTVTGTNNGCTGTALATVTVNPILSSSFPAAICTGSSYLFNGINITTAGAYKDTLTSISGCDSIVTLHLTVDSVLNSSFPVAICTGSSYLFNGINLTTAGAYKDTLNSVSGCDSIITLNLTMNPKPIINISSDTTIAQGTSATLTIVGGNSYNWSPSIGLSSTISNLVIASPSNTTAYCVIVTDTNSCSEDTCVVVIVKQPVEIPPCKSSGVELKVPNAFSPNGDDNNDLYCLQGWNECIESFTIAVYNRWGEKVFESNNPNFCWNGTLRGQPLDAGVFVYIIKAKYHDQFQKIEKRGNVSLIR